MDQIAREKGIDQDKIEVWFADEARIGQKNKITRRWALRGTRPIAAHDQRPASTYIFGAICPKDGKGAALVLPHCNSHAMNLHLAEISNVIAPGAHAALLVDQAGWHLSDKPDFKTIADFRRDNRAAFRPVFRQFVVLCRQLDLFGRELLAVDGTRIKAVNNKDRNFTRASLAQFIKLADAKLDDYLQRLDQSDATEAAAGGSRVKNLTEKIAAVRARRARCQDMLAELERTRSRLPTPTAGRWRHIPMWRSATTRRSRSMPSTT